MPRILRWYPLKNVVGRTTKGVRWVAPIRESLARLGPVEDNSQEYCRAWMAGWIRFTRREEACGAWWVPRQGSSWSQRKPSGGRDEPLRYQLFNGREQDLKGWKDA